MGMGTFRYPGTCIKAIERWAGVQYVCGCDKPYGSRLYVGVQPDDESCYECKYNDELYMHEYMQWIKTLNKRRLKRLQHKILMYGTGSVSDSRKELEDLEIWLHWYIKDSKDMFEAGEPTYIIAPPYNENGTTRLGRHQPGGSQPVCAVLQDDDDPETFTHTAQY